MGRRGLGWGGVVVAAAALAGLGVYFAKVGLEEADQLASVLGLFVAVVGLGVAIFGLRSGSGGGSVRQVAKASGTGRIYLAGRDLKPRRSAQPTSEPGSDGVGSDGPDGQAPRNVYQRATAEDRGHVRLAARDITANDDDDAAGATPHRDGTER